MQVDHQKDAFLESSGMDKAGELMLGVCVSFFALFVIVESVRMPQRGHLGIMMSPGFVPLFTGIVLLFLSLVINVRALRAGGHKHIGALCKSIRDDEELRRFLWILGFMVLYIVGLIGVVPFLAATLIYHVLIFYYLRIGGPLKIVIYTLIATGLVAVFLPRVFDMPVP
ncbi:MAG: tripartite tricarboxylate transporter TctB family protein [Desulfobacterales bacterium]|nr:MAG: tripartite tricarboxylate transporter TctB family protein [Desulfobacterales bacterium]